MPDQASSSLSSGLSLLERSQEAHVTFRLFSFVLFLDLAMVISDGQGLASLLANPETLNTSLALRVDLIFVSYLLVTSLIVPFVAILVWDLLWQTFAFRLHKLDLPTLWRNGYVWFSEVSREAHTSKEPYLLELEEDESLRRRSVSSYTVSASGVLCSRHLTCSTIVSLGRHCFSISVSRAPTGEDYFTVSSP
jgi:hypothetical protein